MQDKPLILIVFAICVFLVAGMAGFISWILLVYQKKNNAFQKQLETIKDNSEKELLRSQLEMQEQTFQYISQEIHDNVGQFISLAKLHLNTIEFANAVSVTEKVELSTELLTKALDDLRDLSKSLSSDLIKSAGLEKAIELQISQLKKTAHYDIQFEVGGSHLYIDDQKEIILFRIFQEALNNIIRHAHASKIEITLLFFQNYLSLTIKDNGKGFYLKDIAEHSRNSSGINNMTKRTKMINGEFNLESKPGVGTTIIIQMPFANISS
jgi:two-component system NarL family sensor kinase